MRCFLSYNKADKEAARSIGAHMVLSGIDVWFDEWEIQAGDSIPGKLNEGLAAFDAFVLLWSADSNRSNWVRQELHSAIMRAVQDGSAKIVPCLLDETPLPALISDRRGVDFSAFHKGVDELLGDLTGSRTRRQRLLAIQAALQEMDVNWITTQHSLQWCAVQGVARQKHWNPGNRSTTNGMIDTRGCDAQAAVGLVAARCRRRRSPRAQLGSRRTRDGAGGAVKR